MKKNGGSGNSHTKVRAHRQVLSDSGKLKEIITIKDYKGNEIHRSVKPLMTEFYLHDFLQVIVGAVLLAIPVGFTEETWKLGEVLPWSNILGILGISILFIGGFVYYHFYRNSVSIHTSHFLWRVGLTYITSFLVVAVLLTLIQQAPWGVNTVVALKRIILVTLPASMSASILDAMK